MKLRILLLVFALATFLGTGILVLQGKPPVYLANSTSFNVSRLPVLQNKNTFPVLSAQGVYAYDLDSGVVLYEKNSDEVLFPASTTKIVTALVAMDIYNMEDVLNTGTFKVEGSKMELVWNENISVKDLLYGLLVLSANDAAEVLAANHPEGRAGFIKQMNLKARELKASSTRFLNPSGLDEEGQKTTAKDLARISSQAMLNESFAEIVGTKSYVAKSADGKLVHPLVNRNELLGEVPGVLGVKTGWTEGARENLVTSIERDGKRVMIALLGSQDRFGETEELIDWIFRSFEWKSLDYSGSP